MKRKVSLTQIDQNLALFRRWAGREVSLRWIPTLLKRVPGAEVYIVGGAVRDALIGRSGRKDLDLVIRNVPLDRLEKELKRLGRVDAVGRVFGVLKFLPRGSKDGAAIDVALPRTEFVFGSGGYKDVDVKSRATLPIEDDLGRRDFTVNAMAWNLKAGALVDPYGGMKDLSRGLLRAVGDPVVRFREDYSRMLRGTRFAVQLGFNIEPGTWKALKSSIHHLNDRRAGVWVVPRETVAKELLKMLAADPVRALDLLDESGAVKALIPELLAMKGCPQPRQYHTEGDCWEHTRLALSMLGGKAFAEEFPDGWTALTAAAVLLHDVGKPPMLRTPERHGTDRIRFDGHDTEGAEMARRIGERLALSSYKEAPHLPRRGGVDVDPEQIYFLVVRHLFTVHGAINEIRPTTLEKVFFNPNLPGDELLKVIFCDSMATLGPKGKPDLKHFRLLRKRLEELKRLSKSRKTLPPPILNGEAIMKILRVKPGPPVGEALRALREQQLSKKIRTRAQAAAFVRKWGERFL